MAQRGGVRDCFEGQGTELQGTFAESSGYGITSRGFDDADDWVFADEGDEDP